MYIKRIMHKYEDFCLNIENIEVENNTVIGLVGENGVGKTTLMSILAGELKANEECSIEDNIDNTNKIMIFSDVELYDYLTVEEFLKIMLKYNKTQVSLEKLIKVLELEDKRNTVIDELSLGMKKKLSLTPIFVKDYELIILDEPFNSIDLNYIYQLKSILGEIKHKSTIVVSSHILDTLVNLCDSIMIMKEGRIDKVVRTNNIKELEREIFEKSY